jgi:hypothetical protein
MEGSMQMISLFILFLATSLTFAQFQWKTTHNGRSRGACQLVSNKIKIIIHNFHIDVEEEAEISTLGRVGWGDPSTLEIFGDVQLSPGSAIRSMLLWNGETILKAKLKDRSAADSAYEDVVDRDKIQFIPRDPALIEGLGDNRYRIKIYPVVINNSRKIRILYSIPLQILGGRPKYEINPLFSNSASVVPDNIPLEFEQHESDTLVYIFQYGQKRKQISSGGVYLIPQINFKKSLSSWNFNTAPLFLYPDIKNWEKAFSHKSEDNEEVEHFTAVFTSQPDTIQKVMNNLKTPHTLEANLNAGEKAYKIDVPNSAFFSAYLKSRMPWDKKICWVLYNGAGNTVLKYHQTLEPDTAVKKVGILPLIWGAKYSLAKMKGNLGALYGFVDMKMSLLALESDFLSPAEADKWRKSGVPFLTREEIILPSVLMPKAPDSHVIFDFSVSVMSEAMLDVLQVKVTGEQLLIHLGNAHGGKLSAVLFDIQGRLIYRWDNVSLNGVTATLQLPAGVHGVYMLRLKLGSHAIKKRITIK